MDGARYVNAATCTFAYAPTNPPVVVDPPNAPSASPARAAASRPGPTASPSVNPTGGVTNSAFAGLLGGGRLAIRVVDAQTLGGFLVACLGYAAAGLALALLFRRSGPALIAGVTYGIGAAALVRSAPLRSGAAASWVLWLPPHVFATLKNRVQFDPQASSALRTQDAAVGLHTPEVVSGLVLYTVAAEIVALVLIAHTAFPRRDL